MKFGLRRALVWVALLAKRLYKKGTFLFLLFLVPALVFGFSVMAEEDSGVVTVLLCCENADDPLASRVTESLSKEKSLIRFRLCESAQEAENLVSLGKADAAWIFCDGMQERIFTFLETRSSRYPIVRVLQREDTVPLRLARERLNETLFECCARDHFLLFVRERESVLSPMTDEEIFEYYDNAFFNGTLFEMKYTDSDISSDSNTETGYLKSPLRGILAIVIVLCGLATAMYFCDDRQRGLFSLLPEERLWSVEIGYQMVSIVHVAAAVFVSLAVIGMVHDPLREALVTLLYCFCVASFCRLLRVLVGRRGIAVLLPVLTVLMIGLCPVFFDLGVSRYPRLLLPPTYYVTAMYNNAYLLYSLIFALAAFLLSLLAERLRFRRFA